MLERDTAAAGRTETEKGLGSEVQRLGHDVGQLRDDLVGIVKSTGEAAQTGVAAVRERAKSRLEAARAEGEQTVATVRGRLADHPKTALGIAVGVGICIGLIGTAVARSRRSAS